MQMLINGIAQKLQVKKKFTNDKISKRKKKQQNSFF